MRWYPYPVDYSQVNYLKLYSCMAHAYLIPPFNRDVGAFGIFTEIE